MFIFFIFFYSVIGGLGAFIRLALLLAVYNW